MRYQRRVTGLGHRRIQWGQAPQEHLFAVNVPSTNPSGQGSESDLTRTDREELQKVYPEWEFQIVKELNKMQASNLIDDLLEKVGKKSSRGRPRWQNREGARA